MSLRRKGAGGENILIPPAIRRNAHLSYSHVENYTQSKAPSLKDMHRKLFSLWQCLQHESHAFTKICMAWYI